jgi:hypothetical protein
VRVPGNGGGGERRRRRRRGREVSPLFPSAEGGPRIHSENFAPATPSVAKNTIACMAGRISAMVR